MDGSENEAPTTVVGCLPSHLFVELTSLDELSFPTNSSARIKYTCVSAAPHCLAVGSSSGSVYLFSRYAARYRKSLGCVPVQVITRKEHEGSVERLSISPDEKHVAIATSRGHLVVATMGMGSEGGGGGGSTALSTAAHAGAELTALCWSDDGRRLFAGDSQGRVSVNRVVGRSVFRAATDLFHAFDSPVVQLDLKADRLLVATRARSYLSPTLSGHAEPLPIGSRPRTGLFGACFFDSDGDPALPLMFVGRPGGRLWEVDADGSVYSTHRFANLTTVPLAPPVSYRSGSAADLRPSNSQQPHTIQFSQIHVLKQSSRACLRESYVVTINGNRVSVVEPKKARVILICDVDEDIRHYSLCGNDLFLLCGSQGDLRKLSLFHYSKAVEKLVWRECFSQAAQLMLAYSTTNSVPWKPKLIQDVANALKRLETDGEGANCVLSERLDEMQMQRSSVEAAEKRKETSPPIPVAERLKTGIHRVVPAIENSGYDDDFTFRAPSPLRLRSKSSPLIPLSDDEGLSASRRRSLAPGAAAWQNGAHAHSPMAVSRSEDSLKTLLNASKAVDSVHFDAFSGETVLRQLGAVADRVPSLPLDKLCIGAAEQLSEQPLIERRGRRKRSPRFAPDRHGNLADHKTKGLVTNELVNGNLLSDHAETLPVVPDAFVTELWNSSRVTENSVPAREPSEDAVLNDLDYIDEQDLSCTKCHLHRSWIALMTLGKYLPLNGSMFTPYTCFDNGGVPTSLADWLDVLRWWVMLAVGGDRQSAILCTECIRAFSCPTFPLHDELPQPQTTSPPASVSVNLDGVPSSQLKAIFRMPLRAGRRMPQPSSSTAIAAVNGKEAPSDPMAYSTYYNPIYESGSTEPPGVAEKWRWLADVNLEALLVAFCCILGADVLAEAFENLPSLWAYMDDSIWAALARACTEISAFPCVDQFAGAALSDAIAGTSFNYEISDERTRVDCGSFVLNASHYCPCCTLRLTARVSESNSMVTAFPCGHVFHKVCLESSMALGHRPADICIICDRSTTV